MEQSSKIINNNYKQQQKQINLVQRGQNTRTLDNVAKNLMFRFSPRLDYATQKICCQTPLAKVCRKAR